MSALRDKLASEIQETIWTDLMQHVLRDAVFLVRGEMDLLDVATAVAEDRVEEVAKWVGDGTLARPSKLEIEAWSATPESRFRFVICAPYVLVMAL